jgi:hypothetical protein
MLITYASHHSWYKSALEHSLNHYGKSDRKKITKSLELAKDQDIRVEFKKADESFFEWFTPMYTQIIGSKRNALIFDVSSLLHTEKEKSFGYMTLTLYENNVPIGGCIFNDYGWYYSIAYRVYKSKWSNPNLPTSPAFYGEYKMDEYTYTSGRKMLSHGRDRNPYGINSSIGLGIFKLATGCTARTALTHDIKQIETSTITEDSLILHHPNTGRIITNATLCCTKESESKYIQLFKYQDRLNITKLYRV